jgi:hypothetical protein
MNAEIIWRLEQSFEEPVVMRAMRIWAETQSEAARTFAAELNRSRFGQEVLMGSAEYAAELNRPRFGREFIMGPTRAAAPAADDVTDHGRRMAGRPFTATADSSGLYNVQQSVPERPFTEPADAVSGPIKRIRRRNTTKTSKGGKVS